ncbi:MAG: hypothetical protein H7839_03535 [Magnetococcus sp. YQC-5]
MINIKKLQQKFAARTKREKVVLHLVSLLCIWVLWQQLFYMPIQNQFTSLNKEIIQLQKKLDELQGVQQQNVAERSLDPNAAVRQQIQQWEDKIKQMDTDLGAAASALIPPDKMVETLKTLLTHRPNVVLRTLQALRVEPITFTGTDVKNAASNDNKTMFFRHDLTVGLELSYLDMVQLLNEIEHLPWVLFWEGVHFSASQYPTVQVTLFLYALTLGEGVIGG